MTTILNVIKPWVIVLVYVIIIVLCTVGNSLVLYVILTRRHMQTVTNCFIASLSVSDLLVGIVVVSLATVQTVGTGLIHGAACQIPIYFESVCCTASVYSLLAITFDRYRAVIHSTMKAFTTQKSLGVILCVWLWSFVYSGKVFILFSVTHHGMETNNTEEEEEEEEETFCNLLVEEEDDDFWFRVADAIILFTIPFIVMTFMYVRITRRLWFPNMAVSSSIRNKRKVVKFLIFDITLFFVCWAPFYIMELVVDGLRLMSVLTEEEEEELENARWFISFRFILILMALSNSFMNTLLYAFFNGNFQAEIKSMLQRPRIGGRVTPQTFITRTSLDKTPVPGISSISGRSKLEPRQSPVMITHNDQLQEDNISYQPQNGQDPDARLTEDKNDWNF